MRTPHMGRDVLWPEPGKEGGWQPLEWPSQFFRVLSSVLFQHEIDGTVATGAWEEKVFTQGCLTKVWCRRSTRQGSVTRALSRRAVTQAETREEEVRDQGPDHSRGTLPTGHLERSQPNGVPRQDTRKKASSPAKAPSWALSRGSQGQPLSEEPLPSRNKQL